MRTRRAWERQESLQHVYTTKRACEVLRICPSILVNPQISAIHAGHFAGGNNSQSPEFSAKLLQKRAETYQNPGSQETGCTYERRELAKQRRSLLQRGTIKPIELAK